MERKIRTRMAPSPTGSLHIGTARTALFNFLFAQKNKGDFILRIEDTDQKRSEKKWEEDIVNYFEWLGISWSEGPYRQSERTNIYIKYLKQLLKEKKAYYCFCTEEELEAHKQYLISIGEPPVYNEKCADLSEEEIENNFKNNKKATVRFKVPSQKIKVFDLIKGELNFDTGLIGDMVIAKNIKETIKDKNWEEIQCLYNFVVVVDDFEMEVTHVIRGEDHISNTPKQVLIQESLGFSQPEYAHLPLILGTDKSKLSKRNATVSVREYKEKGYLSEAIVNFMVLLGWNPGDNREIFSLENLIKEFSITKVQKSGAIFNIQKLDYLNGFYIRKKPLQEITKMCIPYLIDGGLVVPIFKEKQYPPAYGAMEIVQKYKIQETNEEVSLSYLEKIISLHQERLKVLSEIVEFTDFLFKDKINYSKDLLMWKDMSDKEIKENLCLLKELLSKIEKNDWTYKIIQENLLPEAEKAKNRGYLLWPLRASLTGKKASAGPFEIAELLGKDKTIKRIEEAIKKI